MGPISGVTCSSTCLCKEWLVEGCRVMPVDFPQISGVGRMPIPYDELNYQASCAGRTWSSTCRQRNVCSAPVSNLRVLLSSGSPQLEGGCFSFLRLQSPTSFTSLFTEFSSWLLLTVFSSLCQLAPSEEKVPCWPPWVEISKGFNFKGLIWDLQNSKHVTASYCSRGDHNFL